MKTSFLIFALCLALTSFVQKKPTTKKITVTDGMKYSYTLLPKQDSLRWYDPGLDSFEVRMSFHRLKTGYPLSDLIVDTDGAWSEYSSILYTPMSNAENIVNPIGWNFTRNQVTDVSHHDYTLSFIEVDGWVDFGFNGYKIEYHAEVREDYGIAGVSVDKGPETMVDLYKATNATNSQIVFTADSLEDNVGHTIRIRYTAQRNPNANSQKARINLDKFVTYTHQGNFYPDKSQQAMPQMSK